MTPLVLDEEEAVGEDKQHGEDYQDHHQQATDLHDLTSVETRPLEIHSDTVRILLMMERTKIFQILMKYLVIETGCSR